MLSFSNIKYFFAIIPLLLILKGCRQNNQTSAAAENKISYSDPHSFASTDGVFLKHLNLNLEVDFKNKILKGWAEWDIKPGNADTLILDTRDLNVSEVLLDEHTHSSFLFGANDPILGAPLLIPITPSTTKVKIFYKTSPDAAALQWLNPSQTKGKKLPFIYTQSQAILARSWIPCKDSPGIKFTYESTIKVPPNLMALMSAVNDTSLHSDGIYHFNMPYPVPSYLMALTAGNLQFKSLGNTCGVYGEPEILPAAVYEFADLGKMIQTASSIYGPYEWGRYDVVIMPPSFPFGGMENPRLTFATPTIITGDRSLVSLIAHELAHSWSGNLVTNIAWDDFWLNEGFTVYFENRIMEVLYGREYADMHELIGYGELQKTLHEMGETNPETALKQNLKGKDPDDAVNDIAYEKGRFFLLAIEKVAGRDRWDSFVKEYFKQYRFQSISTSDFLAFLNQKLIQNDKELAKKINQNEWINKAGLPAGFPEPYSKSLDEAKKASNEFAKGKLPSTVITQKWHTFQWLHFLRSLPKELTGSQMALLDNTYHFTQSNNAEILCDWFQHAIRNNYQKAFPSMENFLCAVGRRKFIQPLYTLMKEQNMTDLAKKIYAKAKPGYHQVSSHTIDQLLYSE